MCKWEASASSTSSFEAGSVSSGLGVSCLESNSEIGNFVDN